MGLCVGKSPKACTSHYRFSFSAIIVLWNSCSFFSQSQVFSCTACVSNKHFLAFFSLSESFPVLDLLSTVAAAGKNCQCSALGQIVFVSCPMFHVFLLTF